jgi:hypothetical protein
MGLEIGRRSILGVNLRMTELKSPGRLSDLPLRSALLMFGNTGAGWPCAAGAAIADTEIAVPLFIGPA